MLPVQCDKFVEVNRSTLLVLRTIDVVHVLLPFAEQFEANHNKKNLLRLQKEKSQILLVPFLVQLNDIVCRDQSLSHVVFENDLLLPEEKFKINIEHDQINDLLWFFELQQTTNSKDHDPL